MRDRFVRDGKEKREEEKDVEKLVREKNKARNRKNELPT